MTTLPPILAETEINLPKILFGLIFLTIWVISGIVSALNKRQQEARRRQVREELERSAQRAPRQPQVRPPPPIAEGLRQRFPDVLLPPAPLPLPQQPRRSAPRQPVPPPPARRTAKTRQQQQQQRIAAPPLPPPLKEVAAAPMRIEPITPVAPARPKPAVDAAALAKWMNPSTLRQQFMLTEILQPPLALRDAAR